MTTQPTPTRPTRMTSVLYALVYVRREYFLGVGVRHGWVVEFEFVVLLIPIWIVCRPELGGGLWDCHCGTTVSWETDSAQSLATTREPSTRQRKKRDIQGENEHNKEKEKRKRMAIGGDDRMKSGCFTGCRMRVKRLR